MTNNNITPPHRENVRESYVDIGKGLAITAIVFGHIFGAFPTWLTGFWPVAFFFVVAGFYIKEERLEHPLKFVRHKISTLYLPGTIIYLLAVMMHNTLCRWDVYPIGSAHPMTHQPFELWDTKEYIYNLIKTVFVPNGELAMGAMWFLYALFFSLCFLSLIYFVTSRIKEIEGRDKWRGFLIILLSTLSIGLAVYGVKIPRLGNAFTIMIFIYAGMLFKQRCSIRFNSLPMFFVAIVVYAQGIILPHVFPSFPVNRFPDVILPLAMSLAAVYIVLYIARRIERVFVLSKLFVLLGQESLYIMALHIFGFFICTGIINLAGCNAGLTMGNTLYTYNVGNNILLAFLYMLFGLAFPVVTIAVFRVCKTKVMSLMIRR